MIKTYLFFGNIGAGKGTQVKFLKAYFEEKEKKNVVYVYPGQSFRDFIKEEGYTQSIAKDMLDKGHLMPLFLVSEVFSRTVVQGLKSSDDIIVSDGFPRSVDQVSVFESCLKFYNISHTEVVYIEISREEAVKRLALRARHDDSPEAIEKRFDAYETNVLPALNLLKEKGYTVHTINGEQDVLDVQKDVFKALGF